jgi:hypothetical protein
VFYVTLELKFVYYSDQFQIFKWLKAAQLALEFKELGSSVSTGRWL